MQQTANRPVTIPLLPAPLSNNSYFDFTLQECHRFLAEHNASSTNTLSAWQSIVFVIFFFGLLGIIYNYKNFIVTIMCVEVMYLGAVSSFVLYGTTAHDAMSAIYGLLVLIFGACESAVGLGLLVAAYRFGFRIDFLAYALIGG